MEGNSAEEEDWICAEIRVVEEKTGGEINKPNIREIDLLSR